MIRICNFLVALCLVVCCSAQSITLPFSLLSKKEGLPDLTNSYVFRDSYGLTWISSLSGVSLFDGEQTQVFQASNSDSCSITNNLITSEFFEDELGNIWFTTLKSIERYDRNTQCFQTFIIPGTQNKSGDLDYYAFFMDDQFLWLSQGFGEASQLFRFNLEDHKFDYKGSGLLGRRHFFTFNEEKEVDGVLSLMLENDRGVQMVTFGDSILSQQIITPSDLGFEGLAGAGIRDIVVDENGAYWMASDKGVLYWNPSSEETKIIDTFQNEDIGSIWDIEPYGDKQLLLSSTRLGVLILDKESRSISGEILMNLEREIIPFKNPFELYVDDQTFLWVSIWNDGVYYSSLPKQKISNFFHSATQNLPLDNITQVQQVDEDQTLVASSKNGGFILNKNLVYQRDYQVQGALENGKFLVDQKDRLWNYSAQKLQFRDANAWQTVAIPGDFMLVHLLELSEGDFLLISFYNEFLQLNFNRNDQVVVSDQIQLITPGDISNGYYDKAGHFYLFHDADFMSVYKKKEAGFDQIKQLENIGLVRSCFEPAGNTFLYLCSDKGLFKLDKTQLAVSDSALQALSIPGSPSVFAITQASNGDFWLSTNQGILQWRPETNATKLFSQKNGILNEEHAPGAFFMDTQDRLWLGGKKGLSILDTRSVDTLQIVPQIYFQELLINNEPLASDLHIDAVDNIQLKFHENSLHLKFAATEFSAPERNQFKYRMHPGDDWIQLGNRSELYFDRLPYGKYNLEILASNADGVWMESSKKMGIRILAPIWLRPWFLFLASLIVMGIGYWYANERAKKREALRESQRLKELDEVKTRLYSNITHEFRTPLTVISGMSEQITGNLKEKEMISRNSRRLLNLVNQMLDLAKLDDGNLKLHLIHSDVVAFLKYVVETFQPYAASKEIFLDIKAKTPSVLMDYDQDKLDQILSNLLSNAIKFTPEKGSIEVIVDKEDKEEKQARLRIAVKDSGAGIAKEELPNIFDRFYQADNAYSRSGQGTGIGLALTKELSELMGGQIEVKSEVDQGTTFTIFLPIQQTAVWKPFVDPVVSNGVEGITPQAEIPVGTASTVAPHLLIVEDNLDVASYLGSLLQNDYQIEYAPNGRIGLEKAIDLVPDIIISDVMMPEMDGYSLCEALKSALSTSHIPIILLTAKAHMEDKLEGLSKGADAYLTKPFSKEELMIRLQNLIEVRKNIQDKYGRELLSIKLNKEQNQEDEFIGTLRKVVQERISDPKLSPSDLEKAVFLSASQVNRKLKALTKLTPSEFIRSIRLEQAVVLLKTTDLPVTQVAFEVGFNQPGYFTKRFQEKYSMTPSSIRKG